MTPAERSERARIAGLTRALNDPGNAGAERARDALEASWLRKARERHPNLPDSELRRKALILRTLHYRHMAVKSAAVRRRK